MEKQIIWKKIDGYGDYIVYSKGDVISNKRKNPFVLSKCKDSDGYYVVALYLNGERKTMKVHRLVAIAFIPNPENKPEVNHKDGIKANNYDDNLEWNTSLENTQHANITGLTNIKGEKHIKCITNERTVLKIRNRHKKGISYRVLSEEFSINRTTIRDIVTRRTWKHI